MPTITRQQAKAGLANGQKPDGNFFANFIDSLVFKSDDIRALFIQYATQNEAQQGIDNTKIMTALRVKNALDQLKTQLKGNVAQDGDTLQKLRERIRTLEQIVSDNTNNNNAIDKWKELKTFLAGVSDRNTTFIGMMNQKQNIYISDIKYSCQPNNHDGWLLCNGQAVSRTTYAALFRIINTWFGAGDGSTTFNLPDGRGRVPIQTGTGIPGLSDILPGNKGGNNQITLTTEQMPQHIHGTWGHNHRVTVSNDNNGHTGARGGGRGDQFSYNSGTRSVETNWQPDSSTKPAGNGQPIDIRQPYIAIGNLFIYSGVSN